MKVMNPEYEKQKQVSSKNSQQKNLGVTLDRKITWNPHIHLAESNARRKLNIMRKLAGTHFL